MSFADAFHAHLDKCRRCKENPFDLCPFGAIAIKLAAKEAGEEAVKRASAVPGVDAAKEGSGG